MWLFVKSEQYHECFVKTPINKWVTRETKFVDNGYGYGFFLVLLFLQLLYWFGSR